MRGNTRKRPALKLAVQSDKILVALAAAAITAIALYIICAITGALFRFQVPDELLIVAEAMVFVVFLPQAFLVKTHGFIEVDVLASHLSPKIQNGLHILSALFGLLFFGLLSVAGWAALEQSWQLGTRHMGTVDLPEWIGRAVLLLGVLAGFIAQIFVLKRRIKRR